MMDVMVMQFFIIVDLCHCVNERELEERKISQDENLGLFYPLGVIHHRDTSMHMLKWYERS